MYHVDLFLLAHFSIFRVVECDLARPLAVRGPDATEVNVDRTVETLDFVLNEERYLDVLVFKELVHLLADDHIVVCLEVTTHDLQILHCCQNVLLSFRPLDQTLHGS